jgi:DNA (cytosine-5)-methyltransferase 1
MKPQGPYFIDLFAGCGGLSLGLFEAGWQGLFAIEKEPRAFATLSHNLLGHQKHRFAWPRWLKKQAWSLEDLLSNPTARKRLIRLRGRVHLLAGGPPCQGFSSLGRRRAADPRNQLFRQYLSVVRAIQPKMVLIENVQGILHPFRTDTPHRAGEDTRETYAEVIVAELERLNYEVWPNIVFAADYGVPQIRPRFLIVAALKDKLRPAPPDPFKILEANRATFLSQKGLNPNKPITAGQAIADLHTHNRLEPWPENDRFKQGRYGPQRSAYQKLMHGDLNGALADSHRLANHLPRIVEKFAWFQRHFGQGKKLEPQDHGPYPTKKHTINILHPGKPAPTITTLPDDLLHYLEPRILTVRETARLQSFPDWFEFQGKYTTGGKERVKQCPRYTQVGNAVPPLLAEAVGRALLEFRKKALK